MLKETSNFSYFSENILIMKERFDLLKILLKNICETTYDSQAEKFLNDKETEIRNILKKTINKISDTLYKFASTIKDNNLKIGLQKIANDIKKDLDLNKSKLMQFIIDHLKTIKLLAKQVKNEEKSIYKFESDLIIYQNSLRDYENLLSINTEKINSINMFVMMENELCKARDNYKEKLNNLKERDNLYKNNIELYEKRLEDALKLIDLTNIKFEKKLSENEKKNAEFREYIEKKNSELESQVKLLKDKNSVLEANQDRLLKIIDNQSEDIQGLKQKLDIQKSDNTKLIYYLTIQNCLDEIQEASYSDILNSAYNTTGNMIIQSNFYEICQLSGIDLIEIRNKLLKAKSKYYIINEVDIENVISKFIDIETFKKFRNLMNKYRYNINN